MLLQDMFLPRDVRGRNLNAGRYGGITAMDKAVTIAIRRGHAFAITGQPCRTAWGQRVSDPKGFLERFDRQRERVADAALGLDHTWRAWIGLQFAP